MIISLSGVLFESGGDSLSNLAERKLDTVAHALAAYPDRAIRIDGYTDSQGNENKNQELSQRRADAVREYLEQRGVDAERLRAEGKGEANPIASNDTAEGRASNRRVEIIVDRANETSNSSSGDARSSAGPASTRGDGARDPARATPAQPERATPGNSVPESPSAEEPAPPNE